MKIYSLSQQGISNLRRRFIRRLSAILGMAFLIVLGVNWWRGDDNWTITLIVSIVVFVVVVVITFSRGLQQVKEVWESIRVEVGDDYVARSQVRIPQVHISRDEITKIEEIEGGLCIRTSNKLRTLAIPLDLDASDYQEIRSKLSAWKPIQPRSVKVQSAVLLTVLLVGFGVIFISSSLWLVLIVGLAMIGYYGYIYWTVRHAEGVDPQQRRNLLVAFLFPIFVTAMKACFLSSGYESFLRALLSAGQSR